jgi:hypothetical protein
MLKCKEYETNVTTGILKLKKLLYMELFWRKIKIERNAKHREGRESEK